jgi:hypothetical protein
MIQISPSESPAETPTLQVLTLEQVQAAWDKAGIPVLVSMHANKRGSWVITIQGKKRFMSYGPADNTFCLMRKAIRAAVNRQDENFDYEACKENGKFIKSVRDLLGESLKSFCQFINESDEFKLPEVLKVPALKEMESGHTDNKTLFMFCQIIQKRRNGEE